MATVCIQAKVSPDEKCIIKRTLTFPSNVAGKLCKMYVNVVGFTITNWDGAFSFSEPFFLMSSLPQPHSLQSFDPKYAVNSGLNSVIAIISTPIPVIHNQPLTVQLEEGPQEYTFALLNLNLQPPASNQAVNPGEDDIPLAFNIGIMLYFEPIKRNPHFESLESYKTGKPL